MGILNSFEHARVEFLHVTPVQFVISWKAVINSHLPQEAVPSDLEISQGFPALGQCFEIAFKLTLPLRFAS